jgi:hypothetical protein
VCGYSTLDPTHRLVSSKGKFRSGAPFEQLRQRHLKQRQSIRIRRRLDQHTGERGAVALAKGKACGTRGSLDHVSDLGRAGRRKVVGGAGTLEREQIGVELELGVTIAAQGGNQPDPAAVYEAAEHLDEGVLATAAKLCDTLHLLTEADQSKASADCCLGEPLRQVEACSQSRSPPRLALAPSQTRVGTCAEAR